MQIMTVRGPIDPDQLGITQTHEHVLCNMCWRTGSVDDLLNDHPSPPRNSFTLETQAAARSWIRPTMGSDGIPRLFRGSQN